MNQSKWRNFVVGAMIHEGVRQEGNKYIVSISDLTFNLLRDIFTTKYQNFLDSDVRPMYRDAVNLPQGDGSSKKIIDNVALEDYKDYIMSRVGNVDIILDPTADSLNMAVINDPKFKKREAGIGKTISSYYGKGKNEGD
jgi:hypothetical protein